MKPPNDTLSKRTGGHQKIKQLRSKGKDVTLPEFHTALESRYLGLERANVSQLGQLQSIGNQEAFAPHRKALPLKDVRGLRNTQAVMVEPNMGPAVYTANPIHFLSPLGIQRKTRQNDGNSDLKKQRPLIEGYDPAFAKLFPSALI